MLTDRLDTRVGATANAFPDAVALECAGSTLTYKELWDAATEVARHLRPLRPVNGRFGLIVHRRLETFICYLAVLIADGTVVPIAPSQPAARRRAIIQEAELSVVVGTARAEMDYSDWSALDLEAPRGFTVHAIHRDLELAGPAGAESIAYLLFTSGSTGRPKGVPISHANALAFVDQSVPMYELSPKCRMSQLFALTFDVSVYDIFGAWCSGATMVVPTRTEALRPVPWARKARITHWASVPSAIVAARLGNDLREHLPDVRLSLFIGEPLRLDLAGAWADVTPNGAIGNFYGPTELTIAVSTYFLPRNRADWPDTANGTVPIGSVYPNMDWKLSPAKGLAAGVGELLVRGGQRFNGYLNPVDNIGRFAPDYGEAVTSESWYRTGDAVTEVDEGLLHLGRIDNQVKIRGFRVELGEVESALRLHPRVDEAVVVSYRGDPTGIDELAAFIQGEPTDPRELRAHLASYLPYYMLPSWVQFVPDIPLTSSGKIDRVQLRQRAATQKRG